MRGDYDVHVYVYKNGKKKKKKAPGEQAQAAGTHCWASGCIFGKTSTRTTERTLVFVVFRSSLLNCAVSFTKSGSWVVLTTRPLLSMGIKSKTRGWAGWLVDSEGALARHSRWNNESGGKDEEPVLALVLFMAPSYGLYRCLACPRLKMQLPVQRHCYEWRVASMLQVLWPCLRKPCSVESVFKALCMHLCSFGCRQFLFLGVDWKSYSFYNFVMTDLPHIVSHCCCDIADSAEGCDKEGSDSIMPCTKLTALPVSLQTR